MNFSGFKLDGLRELGNKVSPLAQQARQFVSEQVGQNVEKTELPEEYLELEKKVDALKASHQKLLAVTQQYSKESYDYPTNLRETGAELITSITQRANDLASATSTAEAQAAVTRAGPKGVPKTLSHALGRASLSSAESLGASDPYGSALSKYAIASEKLGEARLAQDSAINTHFNAAMGTTLNTSLAFAGRARRQVYQTRLALDAAKTSARSARPEKADQARHEVEKAEDEFVAAVEEATSVMKGCLASPEPISNLVDLVQAQHEYHKRAADILASLVPEIESSKSTKEAEFRESRAQQ
ncbi:hypothetical protein PYCC9005_002338 [Savitreella phatthalungensis]